MAHYSVTYVHYREKERVVGLVGAGKGKKEKERKKRKIETLNRYFYSPIVIRIPNRT